MSIFADDKPSPRSDTDFSAENHVSRKKSAL